MPGPIPYTRFNIVCQVQYPVPGSIPYARFKPGILYQVQPDLVSQFTPGTVPIPGPTLPGIYARLVLRSNLVFSSTQPCNSSRVVPNHPLPINRHHLRRSGIIRKTKNNFISPKATPSNFSLDNPNPYTLVYAGIGLRRSNQPHYSWLSCSLLYPELDFSLKSVSKYYLTLLL